MKRCVLRAVFFRFLICCGALGWASLSRAATVELLGTRLIRDADFYDASSAANAGFLDSIVAGGRLQVYFRNASAEPLTIEDYAINGRRFADWRPVPVGRHLPDSKWWLVWPRVVPPGEIGALRIRLPNLSILRPSPVRLDLYGTRGLLQSMTINPAPSPLWLPFIGFASNMTQGVVYVANQGNQPIQLAKSGGVYIDTKPVAAVLPQTTLPPGGVVPITITLPMALAEGRQCLFQFKAANGQQAFGALRPFQARFGVTLWGFGGELDRLDASNHHISLDIPGFVNALDEPIGGRVLPMTFRDRLYAAWEKNPTTPVMAQFTGYEENLIFGDLPDTQMTHHGNVEQDLSLFLNWPKPIWYLPQNAWGRKEGIGKKENWYPLEDIQRQAFQGVAHGAKNIQWFSYFSLWEQRYGRGGGYDAARLYQDYYMPGAIANPVEWDRVGRISGVLQMLAPYLAISCPLARTANAQKIEVSTLLSGSDRAVVALVDQRTPSDFYYRSDPILRQQVLYGVRVKLALPNFVHAEKAFAVDPLAGVIPVPVQKSPSGETELLLDRLQTAALIVLGDDQDGENLRGAWARVNRTSSPSDDARHTLIAEALPLPAGRWNMPESRYRLQVQAINTGSNALSLLDVQVPFPRDRRLDLNSIRVLEKSAPKTVPVSFYIPQGRVLFEGGKAGLTDTVTPPPGTENLRVAASGGLMRMACRAATNQWSFPVRMKSSGQEGDWYPAHIKTLIIDAKTDEFRWTRGINVIFDHDQNGDGRREDSSSMFLYQASRQEDLGNGWRRYYLDVDQAFHQPGSDEPLTGRWNFWIQVVIGAGRNASESSWALRRVEVADSSSLIIQPVAPLASGELRTFEVYFDVMENGPFPAWALRLPKPPAGASVVKQRASALEQAAVQVEISGQTVKLAPDARVSGIFCQHVAANGAVLSRQLLPKVEPGQSVEAQLTRPCEPGDIIASVPVQPSGEGQTFCFLPDGRSIYGLPVPPAAVLPAAWSAPREGLPLTLDLRPDGREMLVGAGNALQRLDSQGRLLQELSYSGRVFYARYSPDGVSFYVAANLGTAPSGDCQDSHVIRYDAQGREMWRHKAGLTIFDLSVGFPDQGVGYGEWGGHAVRLAPDGKVIWDVPVGGYALRIQPLADGGAFVMNQGSIFRISPAGKLSGRTNEPLSMATALAATPNGRVCAFAGNHVNIAGADGKVVARPYVGRNVRALAISADGRHVAAGSCDGVFQLLAADGGALWEKVDRSSYVTQIRFLPRGGGVVFGREIFAYSPMMGWRFRDVLEAYTLAGAPLWRNEGPWRSQPSMNIFAMDAAGRILALATYGDVRLISLAARPGSNAALYAKPSVGVAAGERAEYADTPERLVALFLRGLEQKNLEQVRRLHHARYKGVGDNYAGAIEMYHRFFGYAEYNGMRYEKLAVQPVAGKQDQVQVEFTLIFPSWGRVLLLLQKTQDEGWQIIERRS